MLDSGRYYRLSRFAMLESTVDGLVLSSPLSSRRFPVKSETVFRLLSLLSRRAIQVHEALDCSKPAARPILRTFFAALQDANLLTVVDADGNTRDRTDRLAHWELHDLLFHCRSRAGRIQNHLGGTFRFKGVLDDEPPIRPAADACAFRLPRPGLDFEAACDSVVSEVLDRRRSARSSETLTIEQISELLYRCCRVLETVDDSAGRHVHKAYPSGGALHPLETYLLVNACEGLTAGLYRYCGLTHALETVRALDDGGDRLLDDALFSAGGMRDRPAVLAVISARFRRTAWKYEGIAYRLMLLEAGALMQTMCVVSESLGIACCALGCGNSDLFSELAGSDYYMETSIAELILGGRVPQ